MDDILSQLGDAAQSGSWVVLAIISVVVIVPVVLKALGKQIPLVDTVLGFLKSFALSLQAKKKAEEVAKQPGVASVVLVKDVDGKVDHMKELK